MFPMPWSLLSHGNSKQLKVEMNCENMKENNLVVLDICELSKVNSYYKVGLKHVIEH